MRKSFTDLRKSILALVEKSSVPLTAHQIRTSLKGTCDLSNVYRGIQFLERERLLESFSLHCEKEGNARFYFGAGGLHSHFIHCEKCHSFTRIKDCVLRGRLKQIEQRYHHRIFRHVLVFIGVCEQCDGTARINQGPGAVSPAN